MNNLSFSLIDALKWAWSNMPIVVMLITISTFFTLVIAVTRFLRNIKEGIKEMATPLGGFITLVFLIIAFVIYIMIRSLVRPFM